VRRAIVDALGRFRTPAAAEAIRARALRDDSYMVEAEAARALGKTKQASALETLLDVIDRPSWADAIRAGAIDGLAALRDERATPHVLARTRYGQPTRARRSAIMAIPKLASDRKGREALEDLLDDPDPHLRIDVVRALLEMGDVKARSALRARLDVDLDARVRRRLREALRDLGGDSKKNLDQLREEFGKLESEHADLKSRIALIEARTSKAKTDSDPKVSEKAAKKAEIAKPAKKTKSKAASKSKAKKGK
jgi:aminopeptidase N